jgi:hypothetical protein
MANDPVVAQLKPDQVQEITTAFIEFDGNHNGFITSQEMKECLRRSNIQFQDAEVDRVISNMDTNRDGTVSYDEYMKFMARVYSGQFDQFQVGPPTPGTNAPYNRNPPYGQNQPPYGQNQPPYGQNQPPYGQNQPPYGQNQPPYGQNQPPYGQNQPPYGQNQPPYGQNQPPYGQNPSNPPPSNYPGSNPASNPFSQGGGNYPPSGGSYNQPPPNYPPRNY